LRTVVTLMNPIDTRATGCWTLELRSNGSCDICQWTPTRKVQVSLRKNPASSSQLIFPQLFLVLILGEYRFSKCQILFNETCDWHSAHSFFFTQSALRAQSITIRYIFVWTFSTYGKKRIYHEVKKYVFKLTCHWKPRGNLNLPINIYKLIYSFHPSKAFVFKTIPWALNSNSVSLKSWQVYIVNWISNTQDILLRQP
jgi:hypothetical protein